MPEQAATPQNPPQNPLPPYMQYRPDEALTRLHQQLLYQLDGLGRHIKTARVVHVKPVLEEHVFPLLQGLMALTSGVQGDLAAYSGSLAQLREDMNDGLDIVVGLPVEEAETLQDVLETAVAPLRELLMSTSDDATAEPPPWEVVKPLMVSMVDAVHAVAEGIDEATLSEEDMAKLDDTDMVGNEDETDAVAPVVADGYTDAPMIIE